MTADDFPRLSTEDFARFDPAPPYDDRVWRAENARIEAENDRAMEEMREELAREHEKAEARENRLAALAVGQEQREARRERRERLMFWIAVFGLMFSIIAAVTGTIAIT